MSNIENIFSKLSEITLDNFSKYKLYHEDELFLDIPESISFDIQNYPVERLLNIQDNEIFIRECYFKILDRHVDQSSFVKYLDVINTGKTTKLDLIKKLNDSYEGKIRGTGLDCSHLENT